MTSGKHRDKTIDTLRGLAIILVVLGHSIQSTYPNFDNIFIYRLIYASHMPLFMFVSGYAAGFSKSPQGGGYLYKKFLALIVPFLGWYTVSYLVNGTYRTIAVGSYISRVIVSPDWGLWFLPILFFCFCLLSIGKALERENGILVYLVLWLLLQAIPSGSYGLTLLKWHFAFFITGYIVNSKYRPSNLKHPLLIMAFSSILYGYGVTLWHRNMTIINFSRLHFLPIPGHSLTHPVVLGSFNYVIAAFGILYCWAFCSAIQRFNAGGMLAFLGLFTLDIYVTHLYLFRLSTGGNIGLFQNLILGLAIPLVLSFLVLRRYKLVNTILLGGRSLKDFNTFPRHLNKLTKD